MFRYDTTQQIVNVERTPSGGIRAQARMGRIGVQEYQLADGSIRRELRLPEEVFAPEALLSARGATVTEGHPDGAVTPENFREVSRGHVGDDARQDGNFVAGSILVNDAGTIGKVERKELCELSFGYRCDVEDRSGVWNGETYDAIQRNIRINHVALLPEGHARGGPELRLRLDSARCIPRRMATLKIDSTDYEVPEKVAEKIRADSARLATVEALAAKTSEDLRAAVQRADAAEREIAARDRAALLVTARRVLGAAYLADKKDAAATDDDTIIRAILKQKLPKLSTEDMDHAGLMMALKIAFADVEPAGDLPGEPPAEPPAESPAMDSIHAVRRLDTGGANESADIYARARQKSEARGRAPLKGN